MRVDRSSLENAWSQFASGALDPAVMLLVETQAALRADAAGTLDAVNLLGGDALECEAPSGLAGDALDSVFARIDALETGSETSRRAARIAGSAIQELLQLPEPLREHALAAAGRKGWEFAGPGIRIMRLPVRSQAEVQLLRIEPGHGAPRHGHSGVEHTLVVTGAFRDEAGRFGVGDISTRQSGDVHRPVAEPGEVCFALAVTEGPIELTGALGMMQRMLTRH